MEGSSRSPSYHDTGPGELRVYDLESGTQRVVATGPGIATPVWSASADSSALVYRFGREIRRYDLATGAPPVTVLSPEGVSAPTPSAFSRDGALLYHAVDLETQGDLFAFSSEGETVSVFDGPEITLTADISRPDNRLAFTRGRTGEDMRIHVTSTPFPAGAASRPVSGFGAFGPRWARDGTSLYFVERSELVQLPVDEDGNPDPDARRTVLRFNRRPTFTWPPFDVHPDGQRLVVTLPVAAPPAQIMVVTGWVDSVRDRIQ